MTPDSTVLQASAALGALLMATAILRACALGDGSAQLDSLLTMPWGVVSLVDLYVGFTLFSGWIWYREQRSGVAVAWTAAMMGLGFFAGSLYVLVALRSAGGDWTRFWLGARASIGERAGRRHSLDANDASEALLHGDSRDAHA